MQDAHPPRSDVLGLGVARAQVGRAQRFAPFFFRLDRVATPGPTPGRAESPRFNPILQSRDEPRFSHVPSNSPRRPVDAGASASEHGSARVAKARRPRRGRVELARESGGAPARMPVIAPISPCRTEVSCSASRPQPSCLALRRLHVLPPAFSRAPSGCRWVFRATRALPRACLDGLSPGRSGEEPSLHGHVSARTGFGRARSLGSTRRNPQIDRCANHKENQA